jgi:CRP-like cAMP-binding protein
LIFEGKANVLVDNKMVAELSDGQFVGEMSYMTGNPTSVDVIADEQLHYLIWDRTELEQLFKKLPALEQVMNVILGKDMAVKLTK